MMFVYSFALAMGLVVSAPWWLARMARSGRYREGLRERLGFVPERLRQAVQAKHVVWLHAVSVGEVLAASRLVGELEVALGAEWIVAVSTTTRTGQALAQKRFGADRVFYMPLDFAFVVRAYLRVLQPKLMVLMESEIWPRLLEECVRRGVPVSVVNARVSDRSFRRAMKLRRLWSRVLRRPTLWLTQSEEDARRLVEMGVPCERVQAAGNLKYDVRAPKQSRVAALIRAAAGERRIVVAGSTLGENPSEDAPLIHAQQSLPAAERPLLVLAPRHPENFDFVYSMAIEYPTLRATQMLAGAAPEAGVAVPLREGERAGVEIVVLDTVGDLAAVYGVADIAFVGGSMVRRGGHNPLEPAQFGVPIIMGPSFENFRGIMEAMIPADAITVLERDADSAGEKLSPRSVPDDLSRALKEELHRLLRSPAEARAMGLRAQQVFQAQQGATSRVVMALARLVQS